MAGMTNPPMEWGYPRTVEGFKHAITRGQYEQGAPDGFFPSAAVFFVCNWAAADGIAEEYNWVVLFWRWCRCFTFQVAKAGTRWIAALTAIYACIGVLLVILMNPRQQQMSVDLHRVFFASSHGVVAMLIGYGLALTAATWRRTTGSSACWGWYFGGAALLPAPHHALLRDEQHLLWRSGPAQYSPLSCFVFLVTTAALVLAALAARMLLRSWTRRPYPARKPPPNPVTKNFMPWCLPACRPCACACPPI